MRAEERRFAAIVGGSALGFLTLVLVIYPAPAAILFLGLVLGSLNALVAMGIVLVYRANRIVNFAQGSLGAMAAGLGGALAVFNGWNFFLAIGVGFAVAVTMGALIEMTIIRRFSKAPRLVLTVATLGIAQLLDALSLFIPRFFDQSNIPEPPKPFQFRFDWHPVIFDGGHLVIIIAVPLIGIGLGVFFTRSRFGIAIRAAAESTDRAALLGIPVRRLNTLVWVLASAMAAAGTLLRLPIQGVPIGSVLGPTLIFRALGAAVIGRMESLPITFAAGIGIGIIQQVVLFETGRTVVADAVVFAIVLVALLVQKRHVARYALTGVASWASVKEVRPIPKELRSLPEIRYGLQVLAGIAGAALLVVPLSWNASRVNLFTVGIVYAIVFCSLYVITGFAGQISLGHLAFTSLGAAVAGSMAQNGNEFFTTLAVAGLCGAVVAILIGIPALKITGPFYAVTSLGFSITMGTYFLNPEYFSWLRPADNVLITRPVIFDKFDLGSEWTYYYFVLLVFGLVALSCWRLRNSRTGRAIIGNRENTRTAQAYGINATRVQLTAFGIAGFFAGLGGALHVYHQERLANSLIGATNSILFFSVGIVGGMGSLVGAMLGAAYFSFISFSSFTRTALSQFFVSGVGVLFILMLLPGGISGLFYSLRDRLLRAIANRRGIHVPSLVADERIVEAEEAHAARPAQVTPPSADPLLITRGVELSYGKTQVLFGVDFHVERGEIVALLGTNGAGKSTLLSAIAGLAPTSAGTITFDGTEITGDDPTATVAKGIVFMPGGKGVFPSLTVEENLRLATWLHADTDEDPDALIEDVLDTFPRLRERLDQNAGNLSGGEQQMLTLGQAFILKPQLLMIDELSLGLAPVIVEQLLGIVRRLHEEGTTVILVEQSVNVAITLAHRAVFLEKGEVRFDGPTRDLLDRPDVLRAVFLEGAGAKDRADEAPTPSEVPIADVDPVVGVPERDLERAAVALDVRDISIRFGGIQAVRDVSFSVKQGEIIGIIGPNGAGKTTVLDLISGFLAPTSGRVLLGGPAAAALSSDDVLATRHDTGLVDVTDMSPDHRAVGGLGRSFQDARLFSAMTVRETIAIALERHIRVRDPISPLVLSPIVAVTEREIDERVEELIELMRLTAYADKFVGELSTGTRRIVDLACTMAHGPSVLLLDEPSSGIAQRETEALGPVLHDIQAQTGTSLIVIEHDMPLICGISDRLVALELGQVITIGEPTEVINDARVVEGYLGGTEEVIFRSGGGSGDQDAGPSADTTRGNRRLRATGR